MSVAFWAIYHSWSRSTASKPSPVGGDVLDEERLTEIEEFDTTGGEVAGTLPSMELDVLAILALPPEFVALLDIEKVKIFFYLRWKVSEFSCRQTGDEANSACSEPAELEYRRVDSLPVLVRPVSSSSRYRQPQPGWPDYIALLFPGNYPGGSRNFAHQFHWESDLTSLWFFLTDVSAKGVVGNSTLVNDWLPSCTTAGQQWHTQDQILSF